MCISLSHHIVIIVYVALFCREATMVLVLSLHRDYSLLPVCDEHVCTTVSDIEPNHMYHKQLSNPTSQCYQCL